MNPTSLRLDGTSATPGADATRLREARPSLGPDFATLFQTRLPDRPPSRPPQAEAGPRSRSDTPRTQGAERSSRPDHPERTARRDDAEDTRTSHTRDKPASTKPLRRAPSAEAPLPSAHPSPAASDPGPPPESGVNPLVQPPDASDAAAGAPQPDTGDEPALAGAPAAAEHPALAWALQWMGRSPASSSGGAVDGTASAHAPTHAPADTAQTGRALAGLSLTNSAPTKATATDDAIGSAATTAALQQGDAAALTDEAAHAHPQAPAAEAKHPAAGEARIEALVGQRPQEAHALAEQLRSRLQVVDPNTEARPHGPRVDLSAGERSHPAWALGTSPSVQGPAGGSFAPQASLPAAPGQPHFASALASQITLWAREGVQRASLTLHPAELGSVDIRITVDGTQTRVEFAAATAQARDALQSALPTLAQMMQESGLSLAGADVRGRDASGPGGGRPQDPAQTGSPDRSEHPDAQAGAPVPAPGLAPPLAAGRVDLYA